MYKTCKRCGEEQECAMFYTGDSSCKACRRAHVRANRAANVEYYRAFDRVRYYEHGHRGDASKKAKARGSAAWRSRNAEKRSAHVAVGNALKRGVLTRPGKCEACGESKFVHGHHDDYSKPLVVRWLCTRCHADHHRKHDIAESSEIMNVARSNKKTG